MTLRGKRPYVTTLLASVVAEDVRMAGRCLVLNMAPRWRAAWWPEFGKLFRPPLLRTRFRDGCRDNPPSREVPDTEAEQSAEKLGRVFVDSRRMLKDDGPLVLTCHHSRPEGWSSLAQASEYPPAAADGQPVD